MTKEVIICPTFAYGDCPYCNKHGYCLMLEQEGEHPIDQCDDYQYCFGDEDEDFEDGDLEMGFDPYAGDYSYDC